MRRKPGPRLCGDARSAGGRTGLHLHTRGVERETTMFSVSNLLCGHDTGNEALRYGHVGLNRGTNGHAMANNGLGRPEYVIYPDAPRPVVVWAVTKACNLRCAHCYASATPGPAP